MNRSPLGPIRSRAVVYTALFAATGALSLVASARQVPPSPSQAKKTATPPASGKQVGLPNLGQAPGPPGGPGGAVAPLASPQRSASSPNLDAEEGDYNAKTGIAHARNFVYTVDDMKVTGQTAVYDKNKKELDAQGSLDLDDPKHHVTGNTSHVDEKKKLAVITGSVVITLKPSPSDPNVPDSEERAKQRQYPVIITCDRADDAYKKEFIILKGHLIFKQKIMKDNGKMVERTLTAEHAEYDGKANKMHLFAPVKSYDSEDQRMEFEKDVFVGTKEGEETVASPGRFSIKFNPDNADDTDDAATEKTNTDNKPPEKKGTPPEKKDTSPAPPSKH